MREPIGVIGAGWVGLVTAACFADAGHEVVVRDVVPERVDELRAGRVSIHEPGLPELLERAGDRLTYTLDIADVFADCRVAFVCVGTPPTYSGDVHPGSTGGTHRGRRHRATSNEYAGSDCHGNACPNRDAHTHAAVAHGDCHGNVDRYQHRNSHRHVYCYRNGHIHRDRHVDRDQHSCSNRNSDTSSAHSHGDPDSNQHARSATPAANRDGNGVANLDARANSHNRPNADVDPCATHRDGDGNTVADRHAATADLDGNRDSRSDKHCHSPAHGDEHRDSGADPDCHLNRDARTANGNGHNPADLYAVRNPHFVAHRDGRSPDRDDGAISDRLTDRDRGCKLDVHGRSDRDGACRRDHGCNVYPNRFARGPNLRAHADSNRDARSGDLGPANDHADSSPDRDRYRHTRADRDSILLASLRHEQVRDARRGAKRLLAPLRFRILSIRTDQPSTSGFGDSQVTSALRSHVKIVEVGPRDGLQNESAVVPTDAKIRFVEELAESGVEIVEATSFVNPRAVPQLADAESVLTGIRRRPGVRYLVLVPNERGLDRALSAGADAIALFAAATDAFSQANLGAPMDEALARFGGVASRARPLGIWLRGYVSVAFGCPYSGSVSPRQAVDVASRLFEFGCAEVALADTIGGAGPDDVAALLDLATRELPTEHLALHLHDTGGRALDNVAAALPYGIRTFDGSAGGLGGCPFAPGAPGNLATESLVEFLTGQNFETGVDLATVRRAIGQLHINSTESEATRSQS